MMINAEEEKQLLDQLGVVGSAQGTHYQQTVEFSGCALTHRYTHVHLLWIRYIDNHFSSRVVPDKVVFFNFHFVH